MMTKGKAERILGADVDTFRKRGSQDTTAEANIEGVAISVTGPTVALALDKLIRQAYELRSRILMRRYNYRCAECGSLKPLQIHHVIFRSHGRSDETEGLAPLCENCHERKHKEKRGLNRLQQC